MSRDPETTLDTADVDNPLVHLFRRYGAPYASTFALALLANLVQMGIGRVPALVTGVAFDAVFFGTTAYDLPLLPAAWIPDGPLGQFWFTVALLGGTYLAMIPIGVAGSLATSWFTKRLLHDVRSETYDAMQRLSLGYFGDQDTGEILAVLNNDVRNLESFTQGSLLSIVRFPLSVAVAFAFMALLNWQLAVLLLFTPVLIAVLSYWYGRRVSPVYEELRERIGSLNARLETNLGGIATIKAYTAEASEVARVRAVAEERLETDIDQAKYTCLIAPGSDLVKNAAVLLVVVLGGLWILGGPPAGLSGSMTAGSLFTFVIYTQSFVSPMRNVPGIVDNYENAKASAARVVGVHTHPDLVPESEDAVEIAGLDGRVAYDDVRFTYDGADEQTLRGVTLDADPGETVGVVGPTGAGKSTLTKLLFRFFDPDEGTVSVDGRDMRDVTRRSLRRHLGYVEQEPFLFYGTVRENIAYGADDPDDEEIRAAAEAAGAHAFVRDLPHGYDTAVGERGVKLSGGQRQRLAIARAMVRDPAVLVLDEATSHVDNETEAVIQRHLDDLTADRTTFVVAHRLSTVRDADTILVMVDGEIVERGSHDELLDRDDLYADLWRVQVGDVSALSEEFVERTRERSTEAQR